MEIFEIIKKRRSVRRYKDQAVPDELIYKIIEAANHAPSACNYQAWKFIIVKSQELKEKLIDNGGSIVIKNSPVGILVLYSNQTHNQQYHDDIQSASAAIQNLNLTAVSLGLATCWICHLPSKNKLRKIFNLPKNYSPIAYLLLGYPETEPKPVPRKYSLEQITSVNKFSEDWPTSQQNNTFIKKVLIKIYNLTPLFIKKSFLNKFIDKNFVKKFDN